MKDGFMSVAAVTPQVKVADVVYNAQQSLAAIMQAAAAGARIIVLPELGLTGYTCEDLFWQDALLNASDQALNKLIDQTAQLDALIMVGVPARINAKLYNCAAVFCHGELLGLVPKKALPTYNEFYESRHFSVGPDATCFVDFAGHDCVTFGAQQLFSCSSMPNLIVAAEICEDLWIPQPPSIAAALAGATVICNLSASNEVVGKADYRRDLVRGQSARLVAGYIYTSAGWGESTTDVVFGGHNLICENGTVLAQSAPFSDEPCISQIDLDRLAAERRRISTFQTAAEARDAADFYVNYFNIALTPTQLTRNVNPHPFVPSNTIRRAERCENIFEIQAHGLAKRLQHTHSQHVVVGVSGGLDSTLASLVCARAFDLLDLDHEGIIAVTMPGFGTTARTHNNATELTAALGATPLEVSIGDAVRQHFADIGHDEAVHDVTYENSQARERTQILMDIANQENGLVIGTGDLSELALGWATYNGDHMSMYAVNTSIPKTLIRHLVAYVADKCESEELSAVLLDVLATPVSPELLPADADGKISQKTEDLVGPYELHDFFLYNMLRCGFPPAKIYRLARIAFDGTNGAQTYDSVTILSWLKVFYHRFFSQQFKRSCLPDGPKVGSVAVSPRGDLRMPSDAVVNLWLDQLEEL
ncbi:NAD(+) synthase [Atopobium fossor]|uniref:NAD(+) synthase n=1 Tax=Atopobium fossor TaxID=39487 RepID=UPI0004001F62|nr:NAD(+) synthase [Atopobium fossor]